VLSLCDDGGGAKLIFRRARILAMETAETVTAGQCACLHAYAPVYAEGTVIRMGEGRYGIYVDADFRDDVAPLLGKRVRILILGLARRKGRRSEGRGASGTP